MKATLIELALMLAVALPGCEGPDEASASGAMDAGAVARSGPPIVGDWFTCDGTCRALRSGGLRFTADLHVHHLVSPNDAQDGYVEGDPYCVGESFASYTHEAGVLTLTFHDGSLETQSDFDIDDAGVTALHGSMRKVRPNGTGRWDHERCLPP